MYQKSSNGNRGALKLENIFGPISFEREVSPALYPNTVPSIEKRRERDVNGMNGNQAENSFENKPTGLLHLTAYPSGRRRVQENVLYNKNRDLGIKPSPYSLSTNVQHMQLFPWSDRDSNRVTNGGKNGIFDKEGGET